MKTAVTISLVPQAKGGPFVFWDGLADGCQRAAALGFDAVEIFPMTAKAIDRAQLADLLAQHRLSLAAVGTGAGWLVHKWSLTHADPVIRSQARDFIREIIDLAGTFKAPAIIGSMQGRLEGAVSRGQALGWLAEALDDLGRHAAAQGQVLLCEPLNRYETNLLNQLADAVELLETIPARNIKILADLFHMNIEEASISKSLRASAVYLGHVHFADSNRRAIGFGHTNMLPIFKTLHSIRYEGYLSAEIFPLPDGDTAARQTVESFRKYVP